MKVRYTKQYTDQHGMVFSPGWIAEHSDPEALRRINLGVCEQVTADGAKSLKLAPENPVFAECAAPEIPAEEPAQRMTINPKRGNK